MAEPGQQIGGFRLVRELGSGGFGSVHLGQDASGGLAAVKLLHPHLAADPQVRRYFSQELVNARKVQGFCLAQVLDGDANTERPWIATEYIDGPTLAQAVREQGPRIGGDLQRLAVQTITALNAIHAAGVVHRDLKPANILLGPDGPRVIDFGIARTLDADTSTPTRIGTLGYMAPEQIEGTALGPAADLFAWGAVIIHAATGEQAFPGSTQAARINRILNHPPQTGDLADPLLGIVLACTAKNPDKRPTARQVLDMLMTGNTTPPPLEPAPRPDGPWDVSEVGEPSEGRVDLGGLFIPRVQGMELRVETVEGTIVATTVVLKDSAIQMQAFAAPEHKGIWAEVREELAAGLTQQGGRAEDVEGPLGWELRARVPDGKHGMQVVRFVGVDGPCWFLRGVISGQGSVQPQAARQLEQILRDTVVVRGDLPMAPRDPIVLKLPGVPVVFAEYPTPDLPGPALPNARRAAR